MDPWLERNWHPFHQAFVVNSAQRLNDVLPDGYASSVEGRVFVDDPLDGNRDVIPDIQITGRRVRSSRPASGGGVALADPILVDLSDYEVTENYISIVDLNANARVVCIIELLSHSNKRRGKGRDLYMHKQGETVASDTALMEIDLLRFGEATTLIARQRSSLATYHACVSAPWKRPTIEYYPIRTWEPLPVLGVPLKQNEPLCPLDLQQVFAETFRRGRYSTKLDYATVPYPPLPDADAAWAKARLAVR